MTKTPTAYKNQALEILNNDNWGEAIGVTFLGGLITAAAGIIPFGSILIGGPITLGITIYFLNITRGNHKELNQIFDGFKDFGNAALAMFLVGLTVVIGTVLLIIPGIIAALALSQTFRILKDNKGISAIDAMSKSHELMKGHRMDLFILYLSFIGWALLCILTCFLGFIVLMPYVQTATTLFYNDLVNNPSVEITELASHLQREN